MWRGGRRHISDALRRVLSSSTMFFLWQQKHQKSLSNCRKSWSAECGRKRDVAPFIFVFRWPTPWALPIITLVPWIRQRLMSQFVALYPQGSIVSTENEQWEENSAICSVVFLYVLCWSITTDIINIWQYMPMSLLSLLVILQCKTPCDRGIYYVINFCHVNSWMMRCFCQSILFNDM